MKRIPDEKIEQMIGNVKASLAIEGLYITEGETKVFKKYLEGVLTEKEVLEIIRKGTWKGDLINGKIEGKTF